MRFVVLAALVVLTFAPKVCTAEQTRTRPAWEYAWLTLEKYDTLMPATTPGGKAFHLKSVSCWFIGPDCTGAAGSKSERDPDLATEAAMQRGAMKEFYEHMGWKVPEKGAIFASAVSELGAQGWEAVPFQPEEKASADGLEKSVKTRLLFKRQKD